MAIKLALVTLAAWSVLCHAGSRKGSSGAPPPSEDTPLFVPLSKCASLGFAPGRVACRSCRDISTALGATSAAARNCAACCSSVLDVQHESGAPRKFDRVAVTLCRGSLKAHGGVNEWVEKQEKKWASKGVAVVEGPACAGDTGGGFMGSFAGMGMGGFPGGADVPPVISLCADEDEDADCVRIPIASFKMEHIDAALERHVQPSGKGEDGEL